MACHFAKEGNGHNAVYAMPACVVLRKVGSLYMTRLLSLLWILLTHLTLAAIWLEARCK